VIVIGEAPGTISFKELTNNNGEVFMKGKGRRKSIGRVFLW
jgi:hypothetical protein